jgi:hypothetical protein
MLKINKIQVTYLKKTTLILIKYKITQNMIIN